MTLAAVITCSDSVSEGRAEDKSGPIAVASLAGLGFEVGDAVVVPDDRTEIAAAVRKSVAGGARVVVCNGGTGIGPRDVTPEAVRDVIGAELPGIGEAMRAAARGRVPMADLSRAVAGIVGSSLVVTLPGSPSGVREGMAEVGPLLHHALEMIDGGGHPGHTHAHGDGRGDGRGEGHGDGRGSTAGYVHDAGHKHGDHIHAEALTDADGEQGGSTFVSPTALDPASVANAVGCPEAGATVVFEGRVRDHDHGRPVFNLRYEGHPDADEILRKVVAEARTRPGVIAAAAQHRVGELDIGDVAFSAAVSTAHRADAFAACQWLVDEVKLRLPIWKLQRFSDGSQEWVNCA